MSKTAGEKKTTEKEPLKKTDIEKENLLQMKIGWERKLTEKTF